MRRVPVRVATPSTESTRGRASRDTPETAWSLTAPFRRLSAPRVIRRRDSH
ncbi:hypothetical protein ACFPRL_02665 [Pseudoclavibacter helvolus]